MSDFDRRQFLKGILGKLAQATGAVVLASTTVAATAKPKSEEKDSPSKDIQKRADALAASRDGEAGEAGADPCGFLNIGLGPGIGFRNGGWPNVGWRNGLWHNGGWPNVGWRNVGWHNGGWPNVGWRNWW